MLLTCIVKSHAFVSFDIFDESRSLEMRIDVICFDILTDQVAKKLAEKGRKLSLTQDDQSSKTKLRHSQSYSFESHGNFIYPWESATFFYSGIQSWMVLEKKKNINPWYLK